MRIGVFDYQGKSHYLIEALAADERFSFQTDPYKCELVLSDTDHPGGAPIGKHDLLKDLSQRGIRIVLYPHGAPPILDHDGIHPLWLPVVCDLVHGEGHREVRRRFGYKRRTEVVGWSYCEMVKLGGPSTAPISQLLFAPIHPWADRQTILPAHKELNRRGYDAFLEHPAPFKTVRMFGADDPNGIDRRFDGVEYTDTRPSMLDAIDEADAVISYGSFAYMALARGKPVVMLDPYPNPWDDTGQFRARHYDDYAEYARYPSGLGDAPLDELFQYDVSEWKRLFVGEPFDPQYFCDLIYQHKTNRAQRRQLAKQ